MNTQQHKREVIGEVATRSSFRETMDHRNIDDSIFINLNLVKYFNIVGDADGFYTAYAIFIGDERVKICGGDSLSEARRSLLEIIYPKRG